jgi:uncharacterized protein (TIGR02466 family)
MKIENVFTNFLATEFLDVDNTALEQFCYKEKTNSVGRVVSNYKGWQSNNVVDAPELQPLLEKLNEQVALIHTHYNFKATKKQSITDVWININSKDSINLAHKHPGAFLSGVYYVKAQKNSGNIIFMNPIEAHEYVIKQDMYDANNGFNSATWWEEPYPGKLIIFPSWLTHYVNPNESVEDRISLAFNTSIV